MKAYTDLPQSRTLSEFLSHTTADQTWERKELQYRHNGNMPFKCYSGIGVPCWSLAALLDVLQKIAYFINEDASINLCSYKNVEWGLSMDYTNIGFITNSNSIDACYEMILKLHELNLL